MRIKLKRAVENSVKHARKHKRLTKARRASTIVAWTEQINIWLANPFESSNPFVDLPASKYLVWFSISCNVFTFNSAQTIADVCRQLAVKESELDWPTERTNVDVSPSEFIYAGIELEQQM